LVVVGVQAHTARQAVFKLAAVASLNRKVHFQTYTTLIAEGASALVAEA
jgi:hypothetical protein